MDEALKVATGDLALAVNRYVHKAILCSHSDFFKAACQPDRFKEGKDNVITLRSQSRPPDRDTVALDEGDDPEAINVLIYHLYHPNTDYITLAGGADMRLVLHARVFAAAEKYDLKGLKLQAVHHARSLLEEAQDDEYVRGQVAEAMDAVYLGTAETVTELRQCMSSALLQNYGELLKVSAIQAAVADIDGLTYALLRKAAEVIGTGVLPQCGSCENPSSHVMKCVALSRTVPRCNYHAEMPCDDCYDDCTLETVFSIE
ncbi:hypothetical protein D0863_04571 [Hortaea werneckii]|uniref:BTB domain-containing protein n=1 Tax=Hortaea werneckii TaxID=91943 RepID=A0A3M7E856_HORWE|nr:hypothetical protein D0863_04571 [Hortaea werneckii]